MNELEKIITWKLSEDETKAYKLALLWTKLLNKHLPEHSDRQMRLSRGNPRKSFIFKICWKLMRETRGILKEEDYEAYLMAQIFALKKIVARDIHANLYSHPIT